VLLPQAWKRLPFGDGSFDAVIASSVFEYLDNVEAVLAECRRVLRPSGHLIFSVPNPAHPSRQLERRLRPMAVIARKMPGVRALPKIGNYLSYLEVSRARFSEAEWRRKAAGAGLEPVAVDPGMPEFAAHPGMMYLVFSNR
jgi:SAM-dependent methyltransferase